MDTHLHVSHHSERTINTIVEKIEHLCADIEKSLALCFEISDETVGNFSITTAQKVSSEFVDRVILNIQKIRNHLKELKKVLHSKSSYFEAYKIM